MKKMEFLVLALSMMVAMVAPALAAQNPEASQGSYDIAVYISGTDILAEDSNGQVISSGVAGTDDSRVIQTAVNAISDGTILLQAGTYTLSDSAEVRVSNPEMGSLTVISTPSEARIYLDGADTGKATPYTFTGISPGVHNVSVKLSGYTTPEPQTVTVTAGGEATADLVLEAEEPSDVQKPYAAHAVPGRINFVDFDFGGEGVAYHDTTAGNQGDYAYRTDDADVDTGKRDAVNVPVIAHTYAGEWLLYSQVQVAESGTYDATFYTSTTEDGKSFSVLVDGKKVATVNAPNTGSWYTFGPTTVQIPLTAGEHTVKIAMDTGWVDMAYVDLKPTSSSPAPSGKPDLVVTDISWDPANPASGSAVTLSATIKNQGSAPTPAGVKHGVLFTFDDGAAGPGVWSDTHTGSIAPGAWVTVTASGGSAGATWEAVAGTHTVKAHVDDVNRIAESDETNNVRTEQITVAKVIPTPTPTEEPSDVQKPYAAHTVPGRINFADFDFGGEGVAYHDTTAGNQGDYAYRTDDADVDTGKRDAVNVPVVAHTYAGEWLSYSQVQVAESGTYDATFYTSTTEDGKSFSVLVDGKKVATVNVPNTGNWYTFGPTTVQIPLTAGEHTVKIAMDTGWVDMAYVEFAPAAPTPTPTPTPKPTPAPTPSSEYGADANPTGNPIGGGNGYTDIISRDDPRVKFIVDTRDELLSALQSARSGDVIYVEGNANIDMSGHFNIQVPAGVTIASNRGENGAAGGRIFQIRLSNDQAADWTPMFKAAGQNVRITGLRIEGPDKTTGSVGQTRLGIFSSYRNLEVDNCEIWGWSGAGVSLYGTGGSDMQSGGYVHHNYIHHCQMNGLGYGVVVSGGSTSLVEANYIDYCRHAIAGSGLPGDGYEARYNICGPNFIASYAYQFDMHGTPDPSGSGTMAGDIIKIHHNTFMATGPADSYAALICGIPRVGAYIDHNWFYYDQAPPIAQMNGKGKITMTDNLIGQKKVLYSSGPIRYW